MLGTNMSRVVVAMLWLLLTLAQIELPADPTCQLGHGWFWETGCSAQSPLETALPDCSGTTTACKETTRATEGQSYARKLMSQSDYVVLTSIIGVGEGTGWGSNVAASVVALNAARVTAHSVCFIRGGSERVSAATIRNGHLLVFNPAAKAMLQTDPMKFLRTYGFGYVLSITFGGSYIGIASARSTSSNSKRDLSLMKGLSLKYAFGTEGQYERALQASGARVEHNLVSRFTGGRRVPFARRPAEINGAYDVWKNSVQSNAVPLVVTVMPWIEVREVSDIISRKDEATRAWFQDTRLPDNFIIALSNEYNLLRFASASVQQARTWRDVDQKMSEKLSDLEREIAEKLKAFAVSGDDALRRLRDQFLQGDKRWFQARSYLRRFHTITGQSGSSSKFKLQSACGSCTAQGSYLALGNSSASEPTRIVLDAPCIPAAVFEKETVSASGGTFRLKTGDMYVTMPRRSHHTWLAAAANSSPTPPGIFQQDIVDAVQHTVRLRSVGWQEFLREVYIVVGAHDSQAVALGTDEDASSVWKVVSV